MASIAACALNMLTKIMTIIHDQAMMATHIRRDTSKAESRSAIKCAVTVMTRDGLPRYIGRISIPSYVSSRHDQAI